MRNSGSRGGSGSSSSSSGNHYGDVPVWRSDDDTGVASSDDVPQLVFWCAVKHRDHQQLL